MKPSNLKKKFEKIPLVFKFYCIGVCRCTHITESQLENAEKLYHQKPVSFNYSVESDLE